MNSRIRATEGMALASPLCARLGAAGKVVLDEPPEPALADLEGFERLRLLHWMNGVGPYRPRVVPCRDTREHGLIANRSPCRPNPRGLSVVRLIGRADRVLRIADVDISDGTPLLDIKPYVPEFDAIPAPAPAGWIGRAPATGVRQEEDRGCGPGVRPARSHGLGRKGARDRPPPWLEHGVSHYPATGWRLESNSITPPYEPTPAPPNSILPHRPAASGSIWANQRRRSAWQVSRTI